MEKDWEARFINYLNTIQNHQKDAAHDIGHFYRVAYTAKQIAALETKDVDSLVILAAAYFHDLVNLPKNHPNSKYSSRYSAETAKEVLKSMKFPTDKIGAVCHAIEAHSFSAGILPETIEAQIVQDADRMEALGALGIMRTFYVSGRMGSKPYHLTDMLARNRPLDDKAFALDHFYCKLFKLPDLMQTTGGRQIAVKRSEFLHLFVRELVVNHQQVKGGALQLAYICHEAGVINQELFDLKDPFAENRALDAKAFVMDRMLENRDNFSEFIFQFLRQSREELVNVWKY